MKSGSVAHVKVRDDRVTGLIASPAPTLAPSEAALLARGLTRVQLGAVLAGCSLAWIRTYVPGTLPRGFRHPCPHRRARPLKRVIVQVVASEETLPDDWLATVVLRLLDDAERRAPHGESEG